MEKAMRTMVVSAFLLLNAIFWLTFPAGAQIGQEVTLYLYGDDPVGEMGYFSTDPPTSSVGQSNDYGPSGGIILNYILGRWETDPIQKDLHINGIVSGAVWLENQNIGPALVTVICNIIVDGVETGDSLESDQIVLENNPQEITFFGNLDLYVDQGERFGIELIADYTGTGFYFYWESVNYDSHITVPANWASLSVYSPTIDEDNEEVTIEAGAVHALGTDELVGYYLQIDGPSTASSITGPTLSPIGTMMIASWIWDYGADNAESGVYEAVVTVTDKCGNQWSDLENFYVGKIQPPPPINNWTVVGQITNDLGFDSAPSLMIDNDGIFWLAFGSDRTGNMEIFVKNSNDGITWSAPIQVTNNVSSDSGPCMIQDSSGVYWLVWSTDRSGFLDIWMSRSLNGVNWDEPYLAVAFDFFNFIPSMIQDSSGTYWMVWANVNLSTFEVHNYISSSEDGISWSTPTTVLAIHDGEFMSSLIQDNTGLYWLAYSALVNDYWELFISSSGDGTNWNAPIQITNDELNNTFPSLIQNAQDGFDIAYYSLDIGEIWRTNSPDAIDWAEKEQVTDVEGYDAVLPSLVQDKNECYWVAWQSDLTGNSEIWLSQKIKSIPPQLAIFEIEGEQEGDIEIKYVLLDGNSDLCTIEPDYSTDGMSFFPATQGAGGDGTSNLVSSPTGVVHTFVWSSGSDLEGIDDPTVYFRITPSDPGIEGESDTTSSFHVDNNEPPEVEIVTPSETQSGDIQITYTLKDEESDALSILAEYSKNSVYYLIASKAEGGDEKEDLTSTPGGKTHTFIWDSKSDLGEVELSAVYFKITPNDNDEGSPAVTSAFYLDNKPPEIDPEPTVVLVTENSATIEWTTDEPSTSMVRYGTATSNEFDESSSELVTAHSMNLTGLIPDTGYLYRVYSVDQYGNGPTDSTEQFFVTKEHVNNPPVVNIISPAEGDKVKGVIDVGGTAADMDYGDYVEYVEYRIDSGAWAKTTGTTYWSFELRTTSLDDGEHTIYIRAYDGELYSDEMGVTIKVENEEEMNFWLWIGIGIAILAACIIIAVVVISAGKRKPQPRYQYEPTFVPERISEPTAVYGDIEAEQMYAQRSEW